jgi:hypothetical protein
LVDSNGRRIGKKKADERHIELRSDGISIGDNASKFMNYFALLVREGYSAQLRIGRRSM